MLEIKADDIDGLTKLVRQLMESGEFQRAEPLAVRALDVNADAPQFELLMDLYAQMGDLKKAAICFEENLNRKDAENIESSETIEALLFLAKWYKE